MSSSNPSFSQSGMDAMSTYFMASHSADLTPFHPTMPPPDHGGYGFGFCLGDAAAGGATAATDVGAQFAVNNLMLASLTSQLFAPAPAPAAHGDHLGARTPPEEEMNGGYDVTDGDSPGAGSLTCPGQSDAHAVAQWSSSNKPYGDWSNADSVHGSYQLAGPPGAAGFYFPLAAGHCTAAPSELSQSLCSESSSDGMSNATDQFSSGASRSGLTHHTSRVEPELSHQVYCPQARCRPVHFAVVVARSPYGPVAQQVLNDVVGHVLHGVADVAAADSASGVDSGSRVSLQASSWSAAAPSVVSCNNQLMASSPEEHSHGGDAGARLGDAQRLRSELLKMLQLMDHKYNQCLDEIQSTTAKFNGLMLSGSSNGSICAPFAHRTVSATYRALRRRITGEIMLAASSSRHSRRADSSMERSREESAFIQKHLAVQQLRRREKQCWRPQRGLPERSVAVLKSWMFDNFLRPYPEDREKDMLAARSGLTRNQVANWFINARVRLWRPLIEELHEELRRSSGGGEEGLAMEYVMSS